MVGGRDREPDACSLRRENKNVETARRGLKGIDDRLPFGAWCFPVDDQRLVAQTECGRQGCREHGLNASILNEHERLLTILLDALQDFEAAHQACGS